ncbi:hypothetical protein FRC04_009252 [Tulasnella sp. 424]|nr:hypothetical protein FRC04_009252 [Tulasnella sp. 424]
MDETEKKKLRRERKDTASESRSSRAQPQPTGKIVGIIKRNWRAQETRSKLSSRRLWLVRYHASDFAIVKPLPFSTKRYPDTGERKPKFCIKSPGNPLLCDGKSDDHNHAVIFMSTRGGVSEAQKGLPLSEDVFAGTNALDVVDGSSTGSITSAAKDEISISAPFSTSGPSSAPV